MDWQPKRKTLDRRKATIQLLTQQQAAGAGSGGSDVPVNVVVDKNGVPVTDKNGAYVTT